MHGQPREATQRPANARSATGLRRPGTITWVDRRRAVLLRPLPDGSIAVDRVERDVPGDGRTYLARVVHAIGDDERVVVVGPWPERTELEREYVAVRGHPERLVDVEPSGPLAAPETADLDEPILVEALRRIAAG